MDPSPTPDVTRILAAVGEGEEGAAERLIPIVYQELRRLAHQRMSHEAPGNTLQPTELVHEAYLRLSGGEAQKWDHRGHFFAAAAEAMRRVLIERARAKASLKRGGDRGRVELSDDAALFDESKPEGLLALDAALARMERSDPRMASIVKLRYFAGLTVDEVATALSLTSRTVHREWATARAWLRTELEAGR